MIYKLLILSSDPSILKWKSLEEKKQQILNTLSKVKNSTWQIEIRQNPISPKVVDGRIDSKWYDSFSHSLFNKGNHFIYIHFSMSQWDAHGLDSSIRGANQVDTDYVGESYGRGNENTKRGKTKENQFVQNVLHEVSHELARTTKVTDNTHKYHSVNPDISGLFTSYDMSLWQPIAQKQLGLIAKLKEKLSSLLKPKLSQPNKLTPLVERKAIEIMSEMEKLGQPVRLVEGFRSIDRQNELYSQGRTKKGAIVTNAKGGESFHNYGVAVDFCFKKEGYNASPKQWETLGKIGEKLGFEWGGRWNGFIDLPHFEMKLGYSLKDFQGNKVDWSKFN